MLSGATDPQRPAPLVPRQEQIQHGYELDCETILLDGAQVRLFTVPGAPLDREHALVCLPGMGASGRSFAPLAPLAQTHSLLFWTPPTQTPTELSPLEHNLALLEAPAAPLPRRFVLLGSSYGSLLALAFALRRPERVRALVLVSPVVSSRRIRRAAMAATTFLRVPLPFAYVFAPLVARILGGRRLPPVGRAEIVREARRIPPRELGRRLMDVLSQDFLPALATMTTPTLLIHGAKDRIVPLSAARDVAARLPFARLEVIQGAAHLPYMSHASVFNQLLSSFLDEVATAARRRPA